MFPADRDPPTYAPPNDPSRASTPPNGTIENPLMKQHWSKEDLVLVFTLAQLSSGRSGEDAVGRALATADLLTKSRAR
jgi:hypothetical protein